MSKLNQKQYDFTLSYIANGFNAYQAALDAGYKPNYALTRSSTMIKHPEIAKRIYKATSDIEEKLKITCLWKATQLKRIIDNIMNAECNTDKTYATVIKAISELNKMQGDYAPNKSINLTLDDTRSKLLEARNQYKDY